VSAASANIASSGAANVIGQDHIVCAAIWPAYDEYQARTKREITLVIIERV